MTLLARDHFFSVVPFACIRGPPRSGNVSRISFSGFETRFVNVTAAEFSGAVCEFSPRSYRLRRSRQHATIKSL